MSQPHEHSKEQRIERARHASRLLEDPLLRETLDSAKQSLTEEWLATTDPQEQYAAWAKVHGLSAVETELRRIVSAGEFAAASSRRDG